MLSLPVELASHGFGRVFVADGAETFWISPLYLTKPARDPINPRPRARAPAPLDHIGEDGAPDFFGFVNQTRGRCRFAAIGTQMCSRLAQAREL